MEILSKRSRSPANAPPKIQKKARIFMVGDDKLDGRTEIEVQKLHDENQADRKAVKQNKNALVERVTHAKRNLAKRQDNVICVSRERERKMEVQRRNFKQKLRNDPQECKKDKHSVTISKQTIVEVDKFQQICELWQTKLSTLSTEMEAKVEYMEAQQVEIALNDIVTFVEMESLKNENEKSQELLQWAIWVQNDTVKCLEESRTNIQNIEVFEAMEKQLMDDRVVELETQLAQKRTVEREKESELASLRADQIEIDHLSHGVSQEVFDALVVDNTRLSEEVQCLKNKLKTKCMEIDSMKDEIATWKQHNDKLREKTWELSEKLDNSEDQIKQQRLVYEEKTKKLQGLLQSIETRETDMTAVLKTAKMEMEKHQQRKDELKILYTKFSSAMDSVSEKTMRLEEIQHELESAQNEVRVLQMQREELQIQLAQLEREKAVQLRETNTMRNELITLRRQCAEIREMEIQQRSLTSKLKTELAAFKALNEHQSVGQPSNENIGRHSDTDSMLVAQVAEKEALQMFIQRYYSAAEDKVKRLSEKVRVLESQSAGIQKKSKEPMASSIA
ncbi:uncharacterized protein PHALS_01248 [Plasmopara halstedii]|uniref:Uncharacterized protein n=1 Tax=Plasmopara halstedii TaxID=4781 RepID=A0A0N7L6Q4_PLAHL|nr:uncharacterized protein PHALS_01248 [Plasmopara halstedii]CEG44923.1 hypothetical protein PHALS_01248 [Plasmopara halstedii]|eukprot:XP_024581292.1 hypothetical protein PHALS_01248 [Plasmopara halstedii]